MCDTLVALPNMVADRALLFGKNSDRQRNEAQTVESHPRALYSKDETLRCTYIEIPQVRSTNAVLISRPFWMWGAEMGANEHNVVIGNEGLHARSAAPVQEALTGMDLLRLALERAHTAREAVEIITSLLEKYGQGGNCGHLTPNYYNNGFLIADPDEAFVLETVERDWLLERVHGVRSISNAYSITDAERVSTGLRTLLEESSAGRTVNYAQALADPGREHIAHGCERRARSNDLLQSHDHHLNTAAVISILRDHGASDPSITWTPSRALKYEVCMHAGTASRPGQTTGSMVSEVRRQMAVHWVTASAAPCISIFKPVFVDLPIPQHGPAPTDRYNADTLWWRHERLHRTALQKDFVRFLDDIRTERDDLESEFRSRINSVLQGGNTSDRLGILEQCWREASELEDRWYERVAQETGRDHGRPYESAWLQMSQIARLETVVEADRAPPLSVLT